MTTTDYAQLKAARELLTRIPLPLDVEPGETPGTPYTVTHDGTASARTLLAAMARQLDDYILPRSASVDNPLTIVVGGSTGAGKSTLVNTLLGEPLTQSGAIRPTTRHPVLLHRAEDEAALSPERFLPTLPRTRTSGMNAGSQALPGLDPKIARALIPITTSALPQGIALIDAPDIDSVSEENRTLAKELLSAADLWLFVTTANRYADAVPWELLHEAAARSIAIAVVLNRVPEGDEEAIENDLRRMLDEAGIHAILIHTVTEQPRDENGMLAPVSLAPLTLWIRELGADAPARAAIARQTLAGAVETLAGNLQVLAAEQARQQAAHQSLASIAAEEYEEALTTIDGALSDGSLLRGEVLSRWHDFVGTGDFFRSLDSTIGRLRDRVGSALRGQPAAAQKVEDALESGIHAVVLDAAARASENTRTRWRASRAGRSLLARLDAPQAVPAAPQAVSAAVEQITDGEAKGEVQSAEDIFSAAVAEQIRLWQGSVLEMIREEGADKRKRARFLSLGVNAAAVMLMVAAFSLTGGITGIEAGIAGGSGVVGTKLLESIFGEDAVRRMATRARTDLLERMANLLTEHAQPFTAVLEETDPQADAEDIHRAAEQVQKIAAEMSAQSQAAQAKSAQTQGAQTPWSATA
ncbi:dynamin family protein [Rothia mucilaginosa]|uniref:Putative ABC iron siderophore transporter n=1 Tax=Rothia mucilaginosa TaxID=43675 RepID=A0A0K2S0T9_9MICC|nr:dynamin family protein [Rothia mucilaginosa]BAS20698.1 putative ABC iron siderophore transporter [Rothia mucilaginosa]